MEMSEKKYRFVNVFLIFGLIFLVFGLVVSFFAPVLAQSVIFETLLLFPIVIGSIITTIAIILTKKGYQLYIGLLLFGWGLFTYLLARIIPSDVFHWWPTYGILAGIYIIIDGLFIYRKIRLGYFFPGLVVTGMSLVYQLFALKIIDIPFKHFVIITGPVLLVLLVVFFSLIFAAQKRTKKLMLSGDQEAFEEERFSVKTED